MNFFLSYNYFRFYFEEEGKQTSSQLLSDLVSKETGQPQSHTRQAIMETDFSSSVVEVAGILIPKFDSVHADNNKVW